MNSQVREASRGKVSAVNMGLGGDGGAHCSVGIHTVFQACAECALYVKGTCFLGTWLCIGTTWRFEDICDPL